MVARIFLSRATEPAARAPREVMDFANVQIEVVLAEAAASALLERIEMGLFPHDGMIVFESDVRVLRAGKF